MIAERATAWERDARNVRVRVTVGTDQSAYSDNRVGIRLRSLRVRFRDDDLPLDPPGANRG